ncbi:MAG: hypothetical protein A2Y75_05365 [Candidatus Solincola sediminis]|uniref:Glycosyltransferase 2-like domain-containing protein n=1 Tax=Candidatus Solincola sediminis TaxID=1797199 RepID=A0A1F2WG84_9ACTN|nr:MAG: hypothetical protein A2Y75_05365 [Candidatus Solincola sediminis]
MNTGYYAVIPTKDRLDCLHNAVNAIKPGALQPYIIVVDNGIDAAMCGDEFYLYDERPPNISRMWNIGLNRAAELATSAGNDEWFVAVINDDVVTPRGWFEAVVRDMEQCQTDAGCSDQHNVVRELYVSASIADYTLQTRLCGYAFVLRGSTGIRLDEQFAWWYGDDDLDWRVRSAGGLSITAGYAVQHLHPNAQTNADQVLIEQTGRDRAAFIAKWGRAPW